MNQFKQNCTKLTECSMTLKLDITIIILSYVFHFVFVFAAIVQEADLVVAPIAINELRATVVDFTTPFYQDYTGVLFERPDPAQHKWKTYFMPFSYQVK